MTIFSRYPCRYNASIKISPGCPETGGGEGPRVSTSEQHTIWSGVGSARAMGGLCPTCTDSWVVGISRSNDTCVASHVTCMFHNLGCWYQLQLLQLTRYLAERKNSDSISFEKLLHDKTLSRNNCDKKTDSGPLCDFLRLAQFHSPAKLFPNH